MTATEYQSSPMGKVVGMVAVLLMIVMGFLAFMSGSGMPVTSSGIDVRGTIDANIVANASSGRKVIGYKVTGEQVEIDADDIDDVFEDMGNSIPVSRRVGGLPLEVGSFDGVRVRLKNGVEVLVNRHSIQHLDRNSTASKKNRYTPDDMGKAFRGCFSSELLGYLQSNGRYLVTCGRFVMVIGCATTGGAWYIATMHGYADEAKMIKRYSEIIQSSVPTVIPRLCTK